MISTNYSDFLVDTYDLQTMFNFFYRLMEKIFELQEQMICQKEILMLSSM